MNLRDQIHSCFNHYWNQCKAVCMRGCMRLNNSGDYCPAEIIREGADHEKDTDRHRHAE